MNLAIITGTTKGLGKALTETLKNEGWRVVEISRPEFDLAALDLQSADGLLKQLSGSEFERAVLINNASEMHIGAAADSADAARRVIQVDLIAAIELTALFLKYFPNGEVAGITSSAARAGVSHWSLYCAAKAGLEGFIRSIKAEGVSTHLFEPGVIDTDMQKMIREAEWPGSGQFAGYHSAGRLKPPSEVAARIVKGLLTPVAS